MSALLIRHLLVIALEITIRGKVALFPTAK